MKLWKGENENLCCYHKPYILHLLGMKSIYLFLAVIYKNIKAIYQLNKGLDSAVC